MNLTNDISLSVSKSNSKILRISCNGALNGADRAIYNIYIDESNYTIHVYDDLRHCSTSIMSVISGRFITELTSLLGIKKQEYSYILYYAPILNIPFVKEYDINSGKFFNADSDKIYSKFLKMTENNEKLIL